MRRLALLVAGGALWLVLAAMPALADGGPHQLAVNNGTSGLSGDCAACHRAHTAQAADLLKQSMPGLCLTCHDGTGATTDVVDGLQYVPNGTTGHSTSTVLGALRGGGFSYALIDSTDASRVSIGGTQTYTLGAVATGGQFTLTWAGTSPGSVTITATEAVSSVQADVNLVFGTSTSYSASGASGMSGTHPENALVSQSTDKKTWTITFQNALRLAPQALASVSGNTLTDAGSAPVGVTAADTTQSGVRAMAAVPVIDPTAPKVATTSSHQGTGTVWGNGAQGISTVGATGVVLDCAKCHNPHGNGQYRILNTTPGEDWATTGPAGSSTLGGAITSGATSIGVAAATGFPTSGSYIVQVDSEQMLVTAGQGTTTWTVTRAENGTTAAAHSSGAKVAWVNWVAPANDVEVADGPALSTDLKAGVTVPVRNYTVLPGNFADEVVAASFTTTSGDYWRYKNDPSGKTNWTNFYLVADPMNTGWNATPTNKASNLVGGVPTSPANTSGLMTAWCISCHTRYNGYTVDTTTGAPKSTSPNGPSSLNMQTPADAEFMYKHGTARIGCEQCHVSHGTDAAMTAQFSSAATFPDGTAEDSALLKLNNRGTCNMCHDPTGTVTPGTVAGNSGKVPGSITAHY